MTQQRIDSLYEALTPDKEEMERYEIVPSSIIKQILGGADSTNKPLQEIVGLLQKNLRVRRVVLLTLVPEKGQIRIKCESVNAATGKRMGKPVEAVTAPQALESTLRKLAYGALPALSDAGNRK